MSDVTDGSRALSANSVSHSIPSAAVGRLASYLRALRSISRNGAAIVSSSELASAASVNSAILRKDLSYVGAGGTRGVGYDVSGLILRISGALHASGELRVALAGAGLLGRALIAHTGVGRGFTVAAMFDDDPSIIGRRYSRTRGRLVEAKQVDADSADHIVVAAMSRIAAVCGGGVDMGVIATADERAQEVCDAFVSAGVRQILNVTTAALQTPEDVVVRPVDLALEMQVLAFDASRDADAVMTRSLS